MSLLQYQKSAGLLLSQKKVVDKTTRINKAPYLYEKVVRTL